MVLFQQQSLRSFDSIIGVTEPGQMSRYRIGRLEDRVDWSNYDYSKLKKREGKESYSTRCS